MSSPVLYDAAGPRARRRIWLGGVVGTLVLLGVLGLAAVQLVDHEQFTAEKWTPFVDEPALWGLLWRGLLATLQAAAYGLVLASALGLVLAVGRLSETSWVRLPSAGVVELFRSVPLLLLIFFFYLAFPLAFGIDLPPLWSLVLGLTLYNGAVICEIVRAGVLSLPKGQTEAAYAVGLRRGQVLRIVLLPQGIRIMLPALVSQLVVLLKDTSLGFIVSYPELLRSAKGAVQILHNPIQLYALVAVIYIVVNSCLSWLAGYVDRRQRQKYGTRAVRTKAVAEAERATVDAELG